MRFLMFYHSLVSDWNHGNAHFLRGVATELASAGHEVGIYEPRDGWSITNLVSEHGQRPVDSQLGSLDLSAALDRADLVLVHEWNEPELVRAIGRHRALRGGYLLL